MTTDFQPLWDEPGVTTTTVASGSSEESSGPSTSTNFDTGRDHSSDLANSPVDAWAMSREDLELALQIINLLLFATFVYYHIRVTDD